MFENTLHAESACDKLTDLQLFGGDLGSVRQRLAGFRDDYIVYGWPASYVGTCGSDSLS